MKRSDAIPGPTTPADAATPKRAAPAISFGAVVRNLDEQLRSQDLWVSDEAELGRIQLIADAVSVVAVHGFMPRSQSDKARDKLAKRLWKIVQASLPHPEEARLKSEDLGSERCNGTASDARSTRPDAGEA